MLSSVTAEETARDVAAIREAGWIVLPELLEASLVAAMRAALRPHLEKELRGRNDFEGYRTARVYSLVGLDPLFADLVEHPRILRICDALLLPNYLLTASQAIEIAPGETPQAWHSDDTFYALPRPRAAVSVSTIWAIDEFTRENGATQVIRGSHRWDDEEAKRSLEGFDFATRPDPERVPVPKSPPPSRWRDLVADVTMPAGSVVVFLGTLVHRGGENRSPRPRLALSNQYCEPWARQQENYTVSVPRSVAARMSPRVQALLGYSIHPPFMGHVRGVHPKRLLEEAAERGGAAPSGDAGGSAGGDR
jgi:ectoine hydroxylase-related dioxygenase (phytanoyl-CoA dioxygenase family)